MTVSVVERPSPNHGPRKGQSGDTGAAVPVTLVVLHYTGMKTCGDALTRMCDPGAEVSAHYLVDEDGTTYQLVPESQRAWHAGRSYWRGISDVNSASIGVEVVNPGHEYGYRPFPATQVDGIAALCRDIMDRHDIPAQNVVGHSDIAPGRKLDPGELFPWAELANAGIGVWPVSPLSGASAGDGTIWDSLAAIGYACPGDETRGGTLLDAQSGEADVISAFQRRFRPSNITGQADPDTVRLAAAVAGLSS